MGVSQRVLLLMKWIKCYITQSVIILFFDWNNPINTCLYHMDHYKVAAKSMSFSGQMEHLYKCQHANSCTKADVDCLVKACKQQIIQVAKGYMKTILKYVDQSKKDLSWADKALEKRRIDTKEYKRRVKIAKDALAKLSQFYNLCVKISQGDMTVLSKINLDYRGKMQR